jgi:hypothetical protein
MSYYADHMRQVLTGRAGDWLARRASPHLTITLAIALSGLGAYECSLRIVNWGSFALRFGVNFLAAYTVFVLCLVFWLWTKRPLDSADLLDGAPGTIETKDPWDDEAIESTERFIEQFRYSAEQEVRQHGAQALLGLAVAAMILGTLFVAAHMIYYARWYLGQLLVEGGKVRHRTLIDKSLVAWILAPFRLTFWAGVILLGHYVILGLLVQWAFPQAVTVADIVGRMRS